jgi:hypothetical protein
MTEPKVKTSLELPATLAEKIKAHMTPMDLPMTAVIRHLLTIGLDAVDNEHDGSLSAAVQAVCAKEAK